MHVRPGYDGADGDAAVGDIQLEYLPVKPLYEELFHSSPHVDLRIRTHQSPEIYNMINNHEVDVGFVFHQSRYKSIIAEDVIQEKMVLLVSSKGDWPQEFIHPSQLDPSYELYLAWSEEIVRWHDYWWRSDIHPYAQVDTASNLTCSPNGVTWNR